MAAGPASETWWAPGRVNLIGEHTDYNGGLALPFAIDRGTTVTASARRGSRLTVRSHRQPDGAGADLADLRAGVPAGVPRWARYPLGVAWALLADGVEVVGTDLAFTSDLPMGAGLSSSASLEVAAATALVSLAGVRLEPERLVAACHRAETEAVGAPVGMLDQLAVVHAVRGHATLIDFSSLEVTPVVLTAGPIAVVDTGVRHDTADVGYRSRRAECRAAALALGVTHLADADPREIEGRLDGVLRRRARHVVGEDARVLEVAHRLGRGQPVGDLLGESHESLRDDFEVSCPELDCAVDAALAAGAAGARLTGAGFGGCVVVLGADPDRLDHGVAAAFAARGWRRPAVWAVTPGGGPAQLD